MPDSPRSFVILPDLLLAGAGDAPIRTFSEYASPDGLTADLATPAATNRGAVQVAQTGKIILPSAITYRVVASGSPWNEGAWAWKGATEPEPARNAIGYRGENDVRYPWACHNPHQSLTGGSSLRALVYSAALGLELLYQPNTSGTVRVAYRSVGDHTHSAEAASPAAWTLSNCGNTDTGLTLYTPSLSGAFDAVELRDGTLLMAMSAEDGRDIDLFQSTDGINWTPVADGIITRFSYWGLGDGASYRMRLVRSGSYVRLVFEWYDINGVVAAVPEYYLRTLVTSDRGASWYETTSDTATMIASRVPQRLAATAGLWDLGGMDDDAGTFMLVVRQGASFQTYLATGAQDWTHHTDTTVSLGAAQIGYSVMCGRGPEWFHVFVTVTPSATPWWDIYHYLVDPRNPYSISSWRRTLNVTASKGAMAYVPLGGKVCNVGGDYLSMAFAQANLAAPGAGPTVGGYGEIYMRWGGWDTLPVEERDHPKLEDAPDYMLQPGTMLDPALLVVTSYSLLQLGWDSWIGAATPAGGADVSANTPWTRPAYNGIVSAWTPSSWKFTDQIIVSNQWVNRYDDATPTANWGYATSVNTPDRSGCAVEAIIQVEAGGSTASDDIAVRLYADDACGIGAGGIDVSLRFSSTQVALYDNAGAVYALAATNIANIGTRFIKFRLGILPQPWKAGDPVAWSLWWRDEESLNPGWTTLGTGTFNTTAAHGNQRLEWGHLTAIVGAGRTSEWRRCVLLGPHDGGATRNVLDGWGDYMGGAGNDDSVIDNLRGRPMSSDAILVRDGIAAIVTGGGGFEGDTFTGVYDYAYHPRNMTMMGSPRVQYRSAIPQTGTTMVQIDYDAGYSDASNRFIHDAFAVFGYTSRQLTIVYASDAAFTTGLTTKTLTLDRYPALRISAAPSGNIVSVATSDPYLPPKGDVWSDPNGGVQHYMKVTAITGGTLPDALGKVLRIVHDYDASSTTRGYRVETGGMDLSTVGLAGCSMVIFADRGAVVWDEPTSSRYMRLIMPATETAYTNQHRLGSFVAGLTLTFDPPLDWTHSDAEQGNVSETTTRSGFHWGYPEAPPQRVFEAVAVGDTDYLRRRMRAWLGVFAQYSAYPVALVTDDADMNNPMKILLGNVQSGSEWSNTGYRHDGTRWIPVGDAKFKLHEEC